MRTIRCAEREHGAAIARLPTLDAGAAFAALPLVLPVFGATEPE